MKRCTIFTLLVLFVCLLALPALAANHVASIDVDVILRRDGSARVTQVWWGDFDEGTECYIPVSDSGRLALSDFTVTSDLAEYESLSDWDVDADFDEKAERCGIRRTEDGYELCWGISEYGRRGYQIAYTVDNMAQRYEEADGLHFMFVNPGMNTVPTDVTLWLALEDGMPLYEDNSAIWAFGCEGQIQFQDGGVYAWSEKPLQKSDSLIVTVEMNQGLIEPASRANGRFEAVLEKAMKGSDYDDGGFDSGVIVVVAVLVLGLVGLIVLVRMRAARRKKEMAALLARCGAFSDVPNGGCLEASYRLGRLFGLCDEGSIVGALLMRLVRDGCVTEEATETGWHGGGKPPKDAALRLVCAPQDPDSSEAWLFDLLATACDDDSHLSSRSLKRFFKRNPESLRQLVQSCEQRADDWLMDAGCFEKKPCGTFKALTEAGQEQLGQLLGLRLFLTDESAQATEVRLTPEDCYAYALLLGLKDETLQRIRGFYPSQVPEMDGYELYYWYAWYYNDYAWHEVRAAEQARSGGSGGSISSGGGGGFSGGGSGGGTR